VKVFSKSKRHEPPSCSSVDVLETSTKLQDSKSESNNSVESETKSEDEFEVVDAPTSSVNSISSIEKEHVPTSEVAMENDTSIEKIEGENSGSSTISSDSSSESSPSDSVSVVDSITSIEIGGLSGNEQSSAAIDSGVDEQSSATDDNVGIAASSESDAEISVRKRCGMDEPDIPLDSSARSSDTMVPLTVSQAVINKLLLDSSDWADEDSVLVSIKKSSSL
jgi:hypothetical protein